MSENQTQLAPVTVEAATPATKKKRKPSKIKARRWPRSFARESYHKCKTHYPDIFTGSRARPLAVGLHNELIADAQAKGIEELHPDVIRAALQWLTEKEKYLLAVIKGGYRYRLDGTQAEALDGSHKNFARVNLEAMKRRIKAAAERAKAAAEKPVTPEAVDQIAKAVADDMPTA